MTDSLRRRQKLADSFIPCVLWFLMSCLAVLSFHPVIHCCSGWHLFSIIYSQLSISQSWSSTVISNNCYLKVNFLVPENLHWDNIVWYSRCWNVKKNRKRVRTKLFGIRENFQISEFKIMIVNCIWTNRISLCQNFRWMTCGFKSFSIVYQTHQANRVV